MESRIMQVFYGNDCLPYKDSAREVHYPITGNSFTGASSTTKVRFYVRDIGGVESATWVAVVKLPNGKIAYQILDTIGSDLELGERYVEFSLTSYYTQYNGDLFIALKGYQGGVNVEEDEDTGIFTIHGTPTIQATGVIKLAINYSTQMPLGQTLSVDEFTQIMSLLAEYLKIESGIVVLLTTEEDITGYSDGQLFYVVSTNLFYRKASGSITPYDLVVGQQATISLIINSLTNINGRVLTAYESTTTYVGGIECYKITRGGSNLTEEYARAYLEYMTGSKFLPRYDYEKPKNTYLLTTTGLILKPQYDSTNGLLLYPMTTIATKSYVDNVANQVKNYSDDNVFVMTSSPQVLTNDEYNFVLKNNVRIKYGDFLFEHSWQSNNPADGNTWCCAGYIVNESTYVSSLNGLQISLSNQSKTLTLVQTQTDFYNESQANAKFVAQTSSNEKVYGTDDVGSQTTYDVDSDLVGDGAVVRRNAGTGTVVVGNPTASNHATRKSYVDTEIAKAGFKLAISGGQSTDYTYTVTLKDKNNNSISTATFDLPLESVVVSGSYDDATESIILTLDNGDTITIPVGDLVSGLVSQSDFNDLSATVTTNNNNAMKYADIIVSGGYVTQLNKNSDTYPIAQNVAVTTIPKVVQSTTDLPATNDGYLYLVLDNGYLYHYVSGTGWAQAYQYTSDLLTITEVTVEED